jgi:hypothetical protein
MLLHERRERLPALPLHVVHDLRAVKRDVEVGRQEPREVPEGRTGRLDKECDQLLPRPRRVRVFINWVERILGDKYR